MIIPMTTKRTTKEKLEQWLRDGWTDHETPLDDYGAEVVREILSLVTEEAPVPLPAHGGQVQALRTALKTVTDDCIVLDGGQFRCVQCLRQRHMQDWTDDDHDIDCSVRAAVVLLAASRPERQEP